jgi:guanylate kinase
VRAPVLVIAAPSGAGKTTVAHALIDRYPERFRFSVSATTRALRGKEQDGTDYHFVDAAGFDAMVEAGALMEWATVHGGRYGTPWSEVRRPVAEDGVALTTVLDIDVQGALQVRERLEEAILLFLFPPSGAVLVERLLSRGTDDGSEIERRMAGALSELDGAEHFDFVVVNDRLDETIAIVAAIVTAESVRTQDRDKVRARAQELKREIKEAASAAP